MGRDIIKSMSKTVKNPVNLTKYAWLSIGAALVTIGLKFGAFGLTGSVGLLSDAFESLVNLVAAVVALWALRVADKKPDRDHQFGHVKAEYFSSGFEAVMIMLAASLIVWSAVPRLFEPVAVEGLSVGLALSLLASAINGLVAWRLFRAGRQYNSITLTADGKHLLTDVWTSVGVILALVLVAVTGWYILDPIVALAVAANIAWMGWKVLRQSMLGLMDTVLPDDDMAQVGIIFDRYKQQQGITVHAVRSRVAGRRKFVYVHVLVPDDWTVKTGHALTEKLEQDIRSVVDNCTVFTHLEPLEDPLSWKDTELGKLE